MTTGAMQRVGGTILFALTPSYAAAPCYALGHQLPDRSFSAHAWALVARLGPVGSYASDPVVVGRAGVTAPVVLDVAEIVRSLRDGGMPVAALAEIARVERKSVYAWLDGGEVRPVNEARVRALHGLLADVGPGYKALWRVWSRPVASGTSLRALLSSEILDVGAVASALEELHPAMERHAAHDAARYPANRHAGNPILSDIPVADLGDAVTVRGPARPSVTTGSEEEAFGADEADRLLQAGWGQGSVARPNEHVPLPPGLDFWPEDVWLVVCTQACGVVSPDIRRDPHVEFALAFAVPRFLPRSPEATGKNVRRFHLPVSGAAFPALDVDVNARFFAPRRILLSFGPDAVRAETPATRDLAGWLGRHYTRIALPNELVRRLGPSLFGTLGKHLTEASGQALAGQPVPRVHESVGAVFVRWSPDTELGPDEVYEVEVLALCDDPTVADELDKRLSTLGRRDDEGVTYTVTVQARAETVLTDLDGWVRLTEWDYLTGMAEAAALPG